MTRGNSRASVRNTPPFLTDESLHLPVLEPRGPQKTKPLTPQFDSYLLHAPEQRLVLVCWVRMVSEMLCKHELYTWLAVFPS